MVNFNSKIADMQQQNVVDDISGVVVPERAGTALRQIFCSRNVVPANTYVTCRNAGAVAFRQIGIEQYELNSRRRSARN